MSDSHPPAAPRSLVEGDRREPFDLEDVRARSKRWTTTCYDTERCIVEIDRLRAALVESAVRHQAVSACINCHTPMLSGVCTYWYGANDVGPFCERCDGLIKVHTRFREAASVSVSDPPEEQDAQRSTSRDRADGVAVPDAPSATSSEVTRASVPSAAPPHDLLGLRKSLLSGLNAIQMFLGGHTNDCNGGEDAPCDCGYINPCGIVDALTDQIERDWPLASPAASASPAPHDQMCWARDTKGFSCELIAGHREPHECLRGLRSFHQWDEYDPSSSPLVPPAPEEP